MPAEFTFSLPTLFGFILVLARLSGIFVFVPLPGIRNGPEPVRALLALAFTFALFPYWPAVPIESTGIGILLGHMASEAALGIAIGVVVAVITEGLAMAGQIVSMQAGYGYASMVDPSTNNDSNVLVVFAQLMAGLLFFTMGLDREVLRIFAASLQSNPPGNVVLTTNTAKLLINTVSQMFTLGLRLALPVVALLVLVDVALALMGRINSHLQMLTLAFPAKMMAALAILAITLMAAPSLYRGYAQSLLAVARVMARIE
jgi:flagellar biosynthetic protein FliR